jgi:signal transduction histidine kinase
VKSQHSLFGRLLVVFFGAAMAIVITFMVSFHYLAEKPFRKTFNQNIVTYTRLIADKIRLDPLGIIKIETSAGVKIITKRREIQRVIQKRDLRFQPIAPYIWVTKPGRTFYVKFDDGFDHFLVRIQDQDYHPENIDAIIVAILIALFILLLTYHLVQKIFRPIDRIQKMTKEYGKGRFDQKIPVEGIGQLAELTKSINDLADRVSSMLNAKRDLFLAIGHELKTPIARLRLQVEMLEGDNQSMVDDLKEMTHIIDQLLEAERVTHHSELNVELVNVKEFLENFQDERVKVKAEKFLHLRLDPIRMELAIRNVVNNAKKYSPDGSEILIELKNDQKEIWITDQGPGVNEQSLASLTEAFYRPDEARTRSQGGVGLGLYLVKNIIDAHHGELLFQNLHPGFRVIISLKTDHNAIS